MVIPRYLLLCLVLAGWAVPARAQTVQQQFVIGGGGAQVQMAQDQQVMFEAANAFVAGDFRSAEALYSQAIALNPNNNDLYLQRAAVRRELGDQSGMEADARTIVAMADSALARSPGDPYLYYQRGMGYRLLREFDKAKADITKGMRMGGKTNWATDLKAIELERRTAE